MGLVFVLFAGIASVYYSLDLEKDILVGTIRTVAQLFLLGYALKVVFDFNHMILVLGVFCFMILFAAWTVNSRIKYKKIPVLLPVTVSMLASYFLVAYLVTGVVVDIQPWWQPRYFIPIGGMVIGNSMNATAISIERLLSDLDSKRKEIEMKLCLGADSSEAVADIVKNAMQAGMIPTINAMMAVGVVFIPGMMTGQIIAGSDPMVAIKYQIVVMVMLAGSTALATLVSVQLVKRRCFTASRNIRRF